MHSIFLAQELFCLFLILFVSTNDLQKIDLLKCPLTGSNMSVSLACS